MPRRPPRFRNFVGQKKHVDFLRRLLDGAQSLGAPFPNCIFLGPSGIGKTLLAREIAAELGTRFTSLMGYASQDDFIGAFRKMEKGDFLFIDEGHAMKPSQQEQLYRVIDEHRIACRGRSQEEQGSDGQLCEVAPCTVVCATNLPGKLLDALKKRISVHVRLNYYPRNEMKEIAEQIAKNLNLLVTPQVTNKIAAISGGIPRRAKHHLEKIRFFIPHAESQQIGLSQLRDYLRSAGINPLGLERSHLRYLQVLHKDRAASLESLFLGLGTDRDDLLTEIEQPLVRLGFVRICAKGRVLTEKGQRYVQRLRRRKGN